MLEVFQACPKKVRILSCSLPVLLLNRLLFLDHEVCEVLRNSTLLTVKKKQKHREAVFFWIMCTHTICSSWEKENDLSSNQPPPLPPPWRPRSLFANFCWLINGVTWDKIHKILKHQIGRLDICQKIYTARFSGQKFYTLKVRKLRHFLLKRNSVNALISVLLVLFCQNLTECVKF